MQQTIDTKSIITKALEDLEKAKRGALSYRIKADITYAEFLTLIKVECQSLMYQRRILDEWIIDDENLPVIVQMHLYLTNNSEFKGSLDKGIFLLGSLGTGKTILLRGFSNIIARLCDRFFAFHSAYNLSKIVIEKGTESYSKAPMVIDDLGKEAEVIKDFGTDTRPISELFASRYDNGALTFCTSNYKMKTFEQKYGEQTCERFLQMFNFIEMVGKSRRK